MICLTGINLTAADTCIIFDSDWNPQNDLQAQARCHRIGQTKSVKVYRLLTRKTYEMQMFHMSSLKMGLDQAVLNGFESGSGGEGAMSKAEVERLLKHGAYDIFNEVKEGSADAESNAFMEQDIDSILARRTKTVVHENTGSKSSAAGGKFSKASFKVAASPSKGNGEGAGKEDVDIDDPDFWKKMVGEEHFEDKMDEYDGKKRERKVQNYSETAYSKMLEQQLGSDDEKSAVPSDDDDDNSDGESDYSDSPDPLVLLDEDLGALGSQGEVLMEMKEITEKKKGKRKESWKWGRKYGHGWNKSSADVLVKGLQTHGYGNIGWEEFRGSLNLVEYSVDEVSEWLLLWFGKRGVTVCVVALRCNMCVCIF